MWRHRIARDRFSGRAGSCVRGLYCTLRELSSCHNYLCRIQVECQLQYLYIWLVPVFENRPRYFTFFFKIKKPRFYVFFETTCQNNVENVIKVSE